MFKQFTTQDITYYPITLEKQYQFQGTASLLNMGIERLYGRVPDNSLFLPSASYEETTGDQNSLYKRLVYKEIKHLYYSNYTQDRYTASGSYKNGEETTLNVSVEEYDTETSTNIGIDTYFTLTESYEKSTIGVVKVPRVKFGDYIKPGSFQLQNTTSSISDDGHGNLYNTYAPDQHLGNIQYRDGIICLTNNILLTQYRAGEYGQAVYGRRDVYGSAAGVGQYLIPSFIDNPDITGSYTSTYTLYRTTYRCLIEPGEFGISQNKTTLNSGSGMYIKSYLTGSGAMPYITTVGLYNDRKELLAVAKVSRPIQVSNKIPLSINICLDVKK